MVYTVINFNKIVTVIVFPGFQMFPGVLLASSLLKMVSDIIKTKPKTKASKIQKVLTLKDKIKKTVCISTSIFIFIENLKWKLGRNLILLI